MEFWQKKKKKKKYQLCLIIERITLRKEKKGMSYNRELHASDIKKKMTCHKVTNLRTEA